MRRKIFFLVFTVMITLMSGVCFGNGAAIGELAIGGVHLGSSYNDVSSMFGKHEYEKPYYNYIYANGLKPCCWDLAWGDCIAVRFGNSVGEQQELATHIRVTNSKNQNNGLETPNGVHVGMPYEEAKMRYRVSTNKSFFFVVSPNKQSYMVISRSYDPVNGVYVVRDIEIRDKKPDSSILAML